MIFIAFAIFIYIIMGKTPIVQMAQLGYYTICAICLITAIAYFTCSIVPIFQRFWNDYQYLNAGWYVGMPDYVGYVNV